MSSLSAFPIEVLEWITGMITTAEQMLLWLCGDRILNIKLKNGGLKRTALCWSSSSWMPWPRPYFTTFSGLEDLEWSVTIGISLCPTLTFNLLPKTLKHLHLACEDVFLLLRKQNVNLSDFLPSLRSLRLSGSRIREENLKNLPASLIELHVTSILASIKSSNLFGDLPRNIQRLTLSFDIQDLSEYENDLPSELISLTVDQLECHFDWFSKLPKSLKILQMMSPRFIRQWLTLPPQLEELRLPSSLLTKWSLLQLPQSLKILELSDVQILTDELMPSLPKNLTRLELARRTLEHSALQQLPAGLTDCKFDVSPTHPDIISFFRPDTIRISLESGPFSDQLNAFPFPAKLQYLSIDYITDDICAMLPPGLQKLKFGRGLITTKGASKFPKSLTSLTASFEVFDDNETMLYLGNISTIRLKTDGNLPATKLDENWISSLLPSSSFPKSSHRGDVSEHTTSNDCNFHLTSLTVTAIGGSVEGYDRPYVRQSLLAALSKFPNLKMLKVSISGGVSSDCLSLIPQSVTSLKIMYLDTFPTAAELSRLPTRLRYLDIGVYESQCDWNDEILQSLPRSLHVFSMYGSFPNLTPRMFEYLPPNLLYTQLKPEGIGSRVKFIEPLDRLYGDIPSTI